MCSVTKCVEEANCVWKMISSVWRDNSVWKETRNNIEDLMKLTKNREQRRKLKSLSQNEFAKMAKQFQKVTKEEAQKKGIGMEMTLDQLQKKWEEAEQQRRAQDEDNRARRERQEEISRCIQEDAMRKKDEKEKLERERAAE